MNLKTTFLYSLGIVCAFVVALSPAACSMRETEAIAQMVKEGVDPEVAACTFNAYGSWVARCAALAARRSK